jgi:hypothetical protein
MQVIVKSRDNEYSCIRQLSLSTLHLMIGSLALHFRYKLQAWLNELPYTSGIGHDTSRVWSINCFLCSAVDRDPDVLFCMILPDPDPTPFDIKICLNYANEYFKVVHGSVKKTVKSGFEMASIRCRPTALFM